MKRCYDATIVHTGDKDASLIFTNDKWVYTDLRGAFSDGDKVTVEIKTRRKPRTLKQNNLLHAYIGILADEFGYDRDDMKEIVRQKWLKEPLYGNNGNEAIDITTGEVLFRLKSTTELSTVQMMELTDQMRIWSMQGWGIILPLPEENIKFNLKTK